MIMIEVDIGIRPEIFLHITMVEYRLITQVSLKKLFKVA